MRRILLIALLLITLGHVNAQLPILRNFAATKYNSGTQNWCITQSNDGRMIFANNSGMLEFDGDQWTSKPISNYTNVRAVLYNEKRNVVYAGSTGEFGYYALDPVTSQLIYQSLSANLPAKEKDFSEIWNIFECSGDIVFQGKTEFFFLNQEGKIREKKEVHRIEHSACINNRIIFSSKDGIFEIVNGKTYELKGTETLKGLTVRSIMPLGRDILFATASDGVYIFDGASATPYIMDITPLLKEYQIFCATTNEKYIAFGTVRGGLIIKNLKTGATNYANTMTGLQNNTVLSLKFDKLSNIWLGLDNGISYMLLNTPYRDLLGDRNSIGTGYTSIIYGGRLYLGTNQGLFSMPGKFSASPSPTAPMIVNGMTGQVWQLQNIDGTLLCGCDGGAFIINGNSCSKIQGPDGTWNFRALSHHPGYVLASDYKGFYILKKSGNGFQFVNRVGGFAETSGSFEEDADGSIWISQWQKGVFHITLDDQLKSVKSVRLYCKDKGLVVNENNVLCKIDGKIYISSVDGIYRCDSRSGKLIYDKPMSMIFNTYGASLKIYETPMHDLLAMKGGFLAIAHREGNSYAVDSTSYRSIASRLEIGLGDIGILDSTHTILNYDNGFYIVDNYFHNYAQDNQLFIRRITGTNDADSVLYAADLANDKKEIEIPHSQNSIKIEFVQPEYLGEKAMEYSCYLENYDEHWGHRQFYTSKEYTHLSKGTYIFHVRAFNSISGKTQETQMTITVLPAWYETYLAYLIYMIIIIAALRYFIIYLKTRADRELKRVKEEQERKLKEQETKLQMEKEKRERELAEMRNQQLNTELKHKSSELADSTMNLIRKNDMLQSMDEDMQNLSESVRREDAKAKITKKIIEIRKGIQSNMTEDDNWEKFEENFNLVYDDFMTKLLIRFPDLKTNERKLCAYLRMGLSSKEMASLLNASVRSMETARYRLRKKLGLEGGDNLTNFIQELGYADKTQTKDKEHTDDGKEL
jgi:DNA-binding CsgD family transcriptional regulator